MEKPAYKPTRVATIAFDYADMGHPDWHESHPVYEYRGLFISRHFACAVTPSSKYYQVFRSFDGGKPQDWATEFGGPEGVFKQLQHATSAIDWHLDYMLKEYA